MNKYTWLLIILVVIASSSVISCKKTENTTDQIVVEQNYVPYKTEKYLRIGYMLKTWEFIKEGLTLERIVVLDNDTKADLMTIEKADLPLIYQDPLPGGQDKIDHYYLSIQLPIPLNQAVPASISHRFILRDTVNNKDVTVEGGIFKPRISESPRLISAPIKGDYYLLDNQSTNGYHYNVTFFLDGTIYTNEKFAFDLNQINETWVTTYSGDPQVNESYFAYLDTLYAVAAGTVLKVVDGRGENSGNLQNLPLNTADEYGGNYLMLDIGGGVYAIYMHCFPGSFKVKAGDVVTEGQPIAQLGNSGNSSEPHLHFQLVDQPDAWRCNGLPFIFKKFTKTGEIIFDSSPGPRPVTPISATNANIENWSIASFQ